MDGQAGAAAFERALLRGDRTAARAALRGGLGDADPIDVTEALVVPALEHIGLAWEVGDISLATLYLSGVLAEEVVSELLPHSRPALEGPSLIAIVVLEDHHVLGKRLVLSALRSAGYAAEDYGHGLAARDVLDRCRAERPRVLLVSTLMLPAALKVGDLAAGLADLEQRPALFVGGAPFSLDRGLAREVGADAAGHNSADALRLVRGVLETPHEADDDAPGAHAHHSAPRGARPRALLPAPHHARSQRAAGPAVTVPPRPRDGGRGPAASAREVRP